ncbi:MAG: beta-ketoacyl-ACP synthase II [Anaerolineae bacterium]
MTSSTPRVVVTGIGCLTPVGNDLKTTWENIKAGHSGIAPITLFDTSNLETRFGGEVKGFDPLAHFDRKEARRLERFMQLAVVAAREAVKDSGLEINEANCERVAVVVGSGIGGAIGLIENTHTFIAKGPKRVSPIFIPMVLIDSAAGMIAIDQQAKGPNLAIVTACATGANAIGESAEMIKRGDADVVIAGGVEAAMFPLTFAGFNVMGALSTRNDDPASACRPFDTTRDGFVMSEGAGILILENEEHAQARGAKIYGVIAGYGTSADAVHFATPDADGAGLVRSMKWALRKANLAPKEIQYINAHGTGTKLNDPTETVAIKQVFGEDAYNIPVSSTKSMLGHMLGAAGAVETIVCLMAMQDSLLPPTIHLNSPDPACDLDYVPNRARPARLDAVMSNSMGLGGHNASVIVTRYA